MTITTAIDINQYDSGKVGGRLICPNCGGVLTEIVSLANQVLIRHKCRRCHKYIMVKVEEAR